MHVSYNGFTGELVKLETSVGILMTDVPFYSLIIYDSEKRVTHSFADVELEGVKFLGGVVSFD